MSAAGDLNSNKDEEDLLKEDLNNLNTGQTSQDKDIFTKTSTDESDKIGGIANVDEINTELLDNSVKDTDNNTMELDTNKTLVTEESVIKTSVSTELSKGDEKCATVDENSSKIEASAVKEVSAVARNVAEGIDGKKTEKDLLGDEIDLDDLILHWDDDDNDNDDGDKLDDTAIESSESKPEVTAVESKLLETESSENKFKPAAEPIPLESETEMLTAKSTRAETDEIETNITVKPITTETTALVVETDILAAEIEKNIIKGKNIELDDSKMDISEDKDASDSEEKLLEDPKSEIPVSDNAKVINEEELLKDDQPDTESMEIDTKPIKDSDSIPKLVDEATKIQNEPFKSDETPDFVDDNQKSDQSSKLATNAQLEKQSTSDIDKMKEENTDTIIPKSKENNPDVNLNTSNDNEVTEMDVITISNTEVSMIPVKVNHGIRQPDVMLEIPTHDLIDIDEVFDSPSGSHIDEFNDTMDDDQNMGEETNEEVITGDLNNKEEVIAEKMEQEMITDGIDVKFVIASDKTSDKMITIDAKDTATAEKNQGDVSNYDKIEDNVGDDKIEKDEGDKFIDDGKSQVDEELKLDDVVIPTETVENVKEGQNTTTQDSTKDQEAILTDIKLSEAETQPKIEKDKQQDADKAVKKESSDVGAIAGPSKALTHTSDSTNEVPEMSDRLGLLAESTRQSDANNDYYDQFDSDNYEPTDLEHLLSDSLLREKQRVKAENDTESDTEMENGEYEIDIDEGNADVKCEDDEYSSTKQEKRGAGQDVTKQPLLPGIKIGPPTSVKLEEGAPIEPEKEKQTEINEELAASKIEEGKEEMITVDNIKKEKEDVVRVRPDLMTQVSVSGRSSVTSNDDCIEQTFELETFKISDDDDSMPASETQPADESTHEKTSEDQGSEKTLLETSNLKADQRKTEVQGQKNDKTVELDDKTLEQADVTGEQVEMGSEEIEKTGETEKMGEVEKTKETSPSSKQSPSKLKNLSISSVNDTSVVNIVDLEESSDEDTENQLDNQLEQTLEKPKSSDENLTSVNIPSGIDIMSSGGDGTSEIVEGVISGVSKPPPVKVVRLNTSELTIKTASSSDHQKLIIPETSMGDFPQIEVKSPAPRISLEIFNLDSDEDEEAPAEQPPKPQPTKPSPAPEKRKKIRKCINYSCDNTKALKAADTSTVIYYDAVKKKKPMVCNTCAAIVIERQKSLIEGIKNNTALLKMVIPSSEHDMVEILDSDSEDDEELPKEDEEKIGEKAAEFLEENLATLLNDAWKLYDFDARLKESEDELNAELKKMEEDSKEIDKLFKDCQTDTDKLRLDLYSTFEFRIQNLPSMLIFDTPSFHYTGPEVAIAVPPSVSTLSRLSGKRKMPPMAESPAKRAAIPLGYEPLNTNKEPEKAPPVDDDEKAPPVDDDKDISVVKLSAEVAPADLPPPGEMTRAPIKVGMAVYAMKNAFGPWLQGKVMEILPKSNNQIAFTTCRVKFDHKPVGSHGKILPARCIAYAQPADVRMTIGTRLIALFKDSNKRESYYSGVVAEIPNPVNNYRYLVFFDDGYAQYVAHPQTRLVCECSPLVWEEVHPFSREFVKEYLMAYPERPMVRLHEGQHMKTEWDGQWWSSRIAKVDASLAQVVFLRDGRREWIYRGSTRLSPLYMAKAAERQRPRPMPRSKQLRTNMPYVEYTRSDEPSAKEDGAPMLTLQQQTEAEIRRQRSVAKKSVTPLSHGAGSPPAPIDDVTSRVVYFTPKNAIKPHKFVVHNCSPKCKRKDVLSLKDLRTYNPLAKPLLSGWERQLCCFKFRKEVMYRSPCGRRLRNMKELHQYLQVTQSDLSVDLFDFNDNTHCLAEFVLNKCLVGKKDLSHGKENVPIPCVNNFDDTLPEFCSYNTERTPTSGVPLNLDPEFLCGCDCTNDCEDKSKCSCWKMTQAGARTIGIDGPNIGYEYKRLPEPLPSGIYECNSRCKCKNTCLNRVAQHPLQLKLQVFKTLNRGWGIRALNDVPKGAFLCVYAGNLLTDATANLDGLNEGDEYLAELDYIEVVEQMKEGYEEDVSDADKKLDKMNIAKQDDEHEMPSSSSDEEDKPSRFDKEDDDFQPGYIADKLVTEFSKRLRRRTRDKEGKKEEKTKKDKSEDDCITISDDEEVREPSRFAAQPGMGGNASMSKYKSVRTLFGEDEACYIVDAKVQGNIGRYLNHSCMPNVFVQNVFVDTHDPRFPWVAFFALSHIKAGTELTWNYNYDIGSVPGKVLYCYCEAHTCRGRLL